MRVAVWRYPVRPGTFDLQMPGRANVLSVQVQDGAPVMWSLVEVDMPTRRRRFALLATGDTFESDDLAPASVAANGVPSFVGTLQMPDGLVFHLFEMGSG